MHRQDRQEYTSKPANDAPRDIREREPIARVSYELVGLPFEGGERGEAAAQPRPEEQVGPPVIGRQPFDDKQGQDSKHERPTHVDDKRAPREAGPTGPLVHPAPDVVAENAAHGAAEPDQDD